MSQNPAARAPPRAGKEFVPVPYRYALFQCLVGAATLLLPSSPAGASETEVTAEEYQLYMDWKDGIEDERLAKYDDQGKLKKIARNLGVSVKVLKAAVARVEPVAAVLPSRAQKAIHEALDTTPLKGQVKLVKVHAGQGHVVADVKWQCGHRRDIDKEAAYAAWGVGSAAKLVRTVRVWCVNEVDTKLFSAIVARSAAERISKSRVERFATSRYIGLFEKVKRGPHR